METNDKDIIYTKEEAFKEINDTQEYYINELIEKLNDKDLDYLKEIDFSSPTGTGKTNMMALLIKKMPDCFFLITTLSKGQLDKQINNNLYCLCKNCNNFIVYGVCKFTANTKLKAKDILGQLPNNGKRLIWLRDEGHIHTNKWTGLLEAKMDKIINFSATNKQNNGVKCNFTNTMMLRTVHEQMGTPEDAIKKLIEVKEKHKIVSDYNPCLICRILDDELLQYTIRLCEEKYNLKCINITEEDFDMSSLCEDNNEYDVIFNKFKIVEGIDIRRAHVLYMDNEPKNCATTIQVIGRCRRNALIYRKDIDVFSLENRKLFEDTRNCYVYYNVVNMKMDRDENGELCNAFCPIISCQQLKANSIIKVKDGKLPNGLEIVELGNDSGIYRVEVDPDTGFNIIKPEGEFYKKEIKICEDLLETSYGVYRKSDIVNNLHARSEEFSVAFDYAIGRRIPKYKQTSLHYNLSDKIISKSIKILDLDNTKHFNFLSFIKKCLNKVLLNKTVSVLKTGKIKNEKEQVVVSVSSQYLEGISFESSIVKHLKLMTDECNLNNLKSAILDSINDSIRNHLDTYTTYIKNIDSYIKKNTTNEHINYDIHSITLMERRIIECKNNVIYIFSPAYEVLSVDKNIMIPPYTRFNINISSVLPMYEQYTTLYNDRESAIIGTDIFNSSYDKNKKERCWFESKAVTTKINKYDKLNEFISTRYSNELNIASKYIKDHHLGIKKKEIKFSNLPKDVNSCLGYCVEYYSKYLVYGEYYMYDFLEKAKKRIRGN